MTTKSRSSLTAEDIADICRAAQEFGIDWVADPDDPRTPIYYDDHAPELARVETPEDF